MQKLIREGRFGPPKVFKTGAVVGTYPRPLLLLNCDTEGWSVFPSRTEKVREDYIPFEVFAEDLTFIKASQLSEYCRKKREDLPPVTVLEVLDFKKHVMLQTYQPLANSKPLNDFVLAVNTLVQQGCPWKTVVLDSITGLNDLIIEHVSEDNPKALLDPRKWAPMAGSKVAQCIGVMTSLPSHCIFIFHESFRENELTQETRIAPLVPSQFRDRVGGLLSQWLYAFKQNGKPMVRTNDFGLVKGIGCRWPSGLPDVCGPTYKDIYGSAL
jgi:hypothetical protein